MNKLILVAMAALCPLLLAGTAGAGAYFSGNLAYVMLDDATITDPTDPGLNGAEFSFDGGFGLMLAVGSELKGFRYEGELSYTMSDMDSISKGALSQSLGGEVTSLSLIGNVFKDFATNSAFTPFAGLGIGISQVEGEITSLGGVPVGPSGDEDDTVFAYQIMLGCAYRLSETMNLDVAYRYFATSDPTFDTVETEISSHNILAGVRMAF